tara:strand:- start:1561 stop:2820 length:1260 start_codon:yes stop_codon:yes gene_type:complete
VFIQIVTKDRAGKLGMEILRLMSLLFMRKKIYVFVLLISALTNITIAYYYDKNNPEPKLKKMHFYIKDSSLAKLSKLRDQALTLGVLMRSPNDYVKANIFYVNQSIECKLRLKGDWIDHLQDKKWSFRVKLKQSTSDGLKTFNITNPLSRGYLLGYVYHKLLRKEDILSPEYSFVEIYMNDVSWGIYVLEEHLTSRMISNQSEDDGVLLKFDDHEFFKAETDESLSPSVGIIKKAKIRVYGSKSVRIEDQGKLRIAKQIIKNYQYQVDTLYNSFDAKKMGTYYAITDLANAYHGIGWINMRFFFNFTTIKMEPVGYDGYPKMDWGKPYLGYNAENAKLDSFDTKMIVYGALNNQIIQKEYISTLKKVTDSLYIQQFLEEEVSYLDYYEAELQKHYPDYHFDNTFLFDNAREIRELFMNK